MKKRPQTFQTHLKTLILQKSALDGERITQKNIADATGIGQATISRWVSGKVHQVDVDTLTRLANYFSCSSHDILVPIQGNNGKKKK